MPRLNMFHPIARNWPTPCAPFCACIVRTKLAKIRFSFPPSARLFLRTNMTSLGDDFEKKEDELFGEEGFFKVVDQVAQLEKKLGIYELAQFTPK